MITSELLEAYLACPMKCYLQSNGEKCSENEFAALYQTQKDSYRHAGIRRLEAGPPHGSARSQIEPRGFRKAEWRLAFNQAFDVDDLSATIHAIQRAPTEGRSFEFIPIRFVHLNKPSRANKMMAVFDAIVLSKAAGQPISVARVIHGDAWTTMKVRVAAHVHELTKTFGKMRVLLAAASPPDLVLNRPLWFAARRIDCGRSDSIISQSALADLRDGIFSNLFQRTQGECSFSGF